jgi:HAD superfamily hydrolase (TIGR01509 family)
VRQHFLGRSFPTVAATIRDRLGVALPPEFEATYRAELLARFETQLRPTPGVLSLLSRLRVPSCVATSSSPPRAARSLAIAGLAPFFGDRVFTASLVARGKPAPDLFLHAAAAMGADPARCVVIEDSRPGVDAARNAGMRVLLYTGGSHMSGKAFDSDPGLAAFDDWSDFPALVPQAFQPA